MLEICEFKPEEIDDAISGMDGLQQIIVPMLRKANYQGMAEQDIQQFLRHITLAKHALVAMGNFLEGQMKAPKEKPLTLEELQKMDGEPVYIVDSSGGHWELSCDADDYIGDRDIAFYGMTCSGKKGSWCSGKCSNGDIGLHHMGWLAYRRKPEEGNDAQH